MMGQVEYGFEKLPNGLGMGHCKSESEPPCSLLIVIYITLFLLVEGGPKLGIHLANARERPPYLSVHSKSLLKIKPWAEWWEWNTISLLFYNINFLVEETILLNQ